MTRENIQSRAYLILRYTLCFFLVYGASVAPVLAQRAQPASSTVAAAEEPIFGSYYDSRNVHFSVLQTRELLPGCRKALSDISPLPATLTLYAQYKTDLTQIYVAGTSDNLKILVLRNGTCDAGVPIMAILKLHHTPRDPIDGPMLSDEEVSGLFGDALSRYATAFGGKARFFQWLDPMTEQAINGCRGQPESSCPPTYHLFEPALQEKLQKFRER
jgi:hypothetical protein